jgi:hypothetical protein
MRKVYMLFVILFCGFNVVAQERKGINYFNLAIEAEAEEIPADAFVSSDFSIYNSLSLKDYKGQDMETSFLSNLVKYILTDDKKRYMDISDKSDTSTAESFEFYKAVITHADNPKLMYKTEAGNKKLFYLQEAGKGFLIVFCLEAKAGKLINHPGILDQPAIYALIRSVNKYEVSPKDFMPKNSIASKYKIIQMDSSDNKSKKGLAFYFSIEKIIFNIEDEKDTASVYPPKYKPVLDFYRQVINVLKSGDLQKYYSYLSNGSRQRIEETFKNSGGVTEKNLSFYKKTMSYYNSVFEIIDLGEMKLLRVANNRATKLKGSAYIYVRETGKSIKVYNLQKEFYLDDLLRTSEFEKILSE